jgi:hypothetical protein
MNDVSETNLPPPGMSISQVKQNFEDWGLCYSDTDAGGLLVKAPLDAVEAVLIEGGGMVKRDVCNETIEEAGLLVLQLKDQDWTVITDAYYMNLDRLKSYAPRSWVWDLQGERLSQRLGTRSILFEASDTVCTLHYSVWDRGNLVEEFKYDESEDPNVEAEGEGLTSENFATFHLPHPPQVFNSQLRTIAAQEIDDAHLFTLDFLESQQVSWLSIYALARLRGIPESDFVRLDLVKVKIFPRPKEHLPPPDLSMTDALNFDEEYPYSYNSFLYTDRVEGLLLKAQLDEVENILVDSSWQLERDVYEGATVGEGLLVFQLQQQEWTVITDASFLKIDTFESHSPPNWDWENRAESLSQQLQNRIFLFGISEHGAKISYSVWDSGIPTEQLKYDSPRDGDPNLVFSSQIREVQVENIENPYEFIFSFLENQQMSWLTLYTLTRFHGVRLADFVRLDFVSWHG